MDALFPIIIILFFAGIAGISIALAANHAKNTKEAYGALAQRFGGRLHDEGWFGRPSVTFDYRGTWVRVDIHSTGGKNPTYYTQVHIGWPQPGFRCEVYPEGFFHRIGKFLGMEDIEIGSPVFDRDYIITGNDRGALKEMLNVEVQSIINQLQVMRGGSIYVAVRNYELLIKKQGKITDARTLEYLTRLSLQLHDAALVPANHGIEFVDASPADGPAEKPVCQVCGDEITSDLVFCKSCRTPHHHDCWKYYGQCSTYGCQQRQCVRPKRRKKAR